MSSWQVQHGQSVYRVEVKMDKPTPGRAIELAEHNEKMSGLARAAESETSNPEWMTIIARHSDTAAILRDYADLRRKWDAVVNAEPVAWQEARDPCLVMTGKCPTWQGWEDRFIPLIRKPE